MTNPETPESKPKSGFMGMFDKVKEAVSNAMPSDATMDEFKLKVKTQAGVLSDNISENIKKIDVDKISDKIKESVKSVTGQSEKDKAENSHLGNTPPSQDSTFKDENSDPNRKDNQK